MSAWGGTAQRGSLHQGFDPKPAQCLQCRRVYLSPALLWVRRFQCMAVRSSMSSSGLQYHLSHSLCEVFKKKKVLIFKGKTWTSSSSPQSLYKMQVLSKKDKNWPELWCVLGLWKTILLRFALSLWIFEWDADPDYVWRGAPFQSFICGCCWSPPRITWLDSGMFPFFKPKDFPSHSLSFPWDFFPIAFHSAAGDVARAVLRTWVYKNNCSECRWKLPLLA